jgi:hypothetical protein
MKTPPQQHAKAEQKPGFSTLSAQTTKNDRPRHYYWHKRFRNVS